MRTFRHWNPRYVRDRLSVMAFERRHPDAPWLTRLMITILSSWLKPGDCGLEWGSGRSTVWLASRVGRLTSVEHDEAWYQRVKVELQEKGLKNVDYCLCKDETEYVYVADRIEAASLDFCLVDGVVRDACALATLALLKPGGILIVDNCNWYLPSQSKAPNSRRESDGPASDAWKMFLAAVQDWRYVWTTSGVTDTALWLKPM